MSEDTTVVVAVPTYNNEDTIGPTLEMVTGQTRPPDRVVVCDKSDDRTPSIVREFDDRTDVTVELIRQTGDGVADAYDEILEYVAGEYDLLVTLQTNLVVDEDWLEGHVHLHREHPEIDLVTGDNKANDPTDREVGPDERPYYVGRNFSAKAGTLERIDGWDRNFLRGEDWDMRIRLAGAGTRTYACTAIGYTWQTTDPYVTLSKARRKPTSLTFLAKFGTWYLRFHPSHVVSDALGVAAVAAAVLGVGLLPVAPTLAAAAVVGLAGSVLAYVAGHLLMRGGVDGSYVLGPVRKQLLNGVAVLYAARRVLGSAPDWNMAGFDPDSVPRYEF